MRDRSGTVLLRGVHVPWSTTFEVDLAQIYTEEMRRRGVKPPKNASVDQLGSLLHDWRRRRLEDLEGRNVSVHMSRELAARPNLHPAVKDIAAAARDGRPLWPHTSTRTKHLKRWDDLLNHWGIVHFHLGKSLNSAAYVSRTDALLFARTALSELYLIEVFDHEHFQDRTLVDIAIRNWPESFESFRLVGVAPRGIPSTPNIVASGQMKEFTRTVMMHATRAVNASVTKEHRQQGLNATFEAENGAHYYPPGGGYSCARTSLLSQVHADHEIWWAGQLAQTVAYEIDQIANKIGSLRQVASLKALKLRLRSMDEMKKGFVFEDCTGTGLQFPMEFDHHYDPTALLKCLAAAAMT